MVTPMIKVLIKQLFKKPVTNAFPAKYMPESVTELLAKVEKGEAEINPPVETPPDFRGKPTYDREKCIGCRMCIKVCPTGAIEFIPETRKVKIFLARCAFCSQCVDACPVKCLCMSGEFLLSDYDKYSENLIVGQQISSLQNL